MTNLASRIATTAATVSLFALSTANVFAASYTGTPWVYDPDNTGGSVAQAINSTTVRLEKNVPTPTNTAAGVALDGVNGLSTTGLTLGFHVNGYCGAGAPRFNVYLSNGDTIFLGCIYGNDGSGNVTFTAGNTYGGVLFPEGQTIVGIDIVQDEQGQTTLSNITVNGQTVIFSAEMLKDQCKKGGYKNFTGQNGTPGPFKNQGQCVSYFNHAG